MEVDDQYPFPCPVERTVASALLLLSTTPPALSPPIVKRSKTDDEPESLVAFCRGINSKSCASTSSSTVISNGGSFLETQVRRINLVPHVDRFHEMMTMKVVRKSRSKTFCISGSQKTFSNDLAKLHSSGTTLEKTETSSCLTTESSSISSGWSSNAATMKIGKEEAETTSSLARVTKRKAACGSGFLSGRCEAIMKLLSNGCCISEVRIRQLLGDSPDTSKALRMLLRKDKVRRSGAGGRTDPYVYQVNIEK